MALPCEIPKSQISKAFDDYLRNLDAAKQSPDVILSDERAKERYETKLMYAFHKYRAAVYHLNNVKSFIKQDEAEFDRLSPWPQPDSGASSEIRVKITQSQFAVSRSADHYVYELSAFLQAIKSSLDFLATVCSLHLKGITSDTISTFIKGVDKGVTGPIYDVVRDNLEWIKELREYRHHLVHRLLINARTGYQVDALRSHTSKTLYPVVIPRKTPKYVPDTRKARMLEETPKGLTFTQEVLSDITDGNEKIIEFSVEALPGYGYMRIEEFMESHLVAYERFFAQLICSLENLAFKAV